VKIKSQKDFWSGVMFVVVGVAFVWAATGYEFGRSVRPGPGYLPLGLGALLALLGSVVLFKALTLETDDGEPLGVVPWRPLLLVLGAVALFGLALPRLGLIITVPLFVGMASTADASFRWKEVLVNSLVLTVASWGLFIRALALPIPTWPSWQTAFG
jgi:hypothetical protein